MTLQLHVFSMVTFQAIHLFKNLCETDHINFVSVKKGKGPKMNLSVVVPKINNFFVPGKAKSAKQTSLHGL